MLQQRVRLSWGCWIVFFGCALVMTGCPGGGAKRETATISGKVTLDGKPLNAGRVIFAHVEGPAAAADIQPDGTYKVEAAVGMTRVAIDHRGAPEAVPGSREGMMGPGKSLVPEKYAVADTSGLTLDVKSGKNDFNIEMKQ